MRIFTSTIMTGVFVFLFPLSLSAELIDRVVGVVGNDVITQSELQEAMLTLGGFGASQRPEEVLTQLIERKLLLIQAEKESLEVKPDELKDAVEGAMLDARGRFPTDSVFLNELQKAGMTEADLKEKYSKQIRETLLIQKLFQAKFGKKLAINDVEARSFYNTHKDSIPPQPAGVRLVGVLVPYKISEDATLKTKNRAEKVLKLAMQGKSFDDLVKTYSDDEKTKAQAGVLGTVSMNDLSQDIRNVVEGLKEGEAGIVGIDKSWHIIKCDARYKDMVTLREVVVKVTATSKDSIATDKIAKRVKESLQQSSDSLQLFQELTFLSENEKVIEIVSKGDDFIPLYLTPFASTNEVKLDQVYTFFTPEGCHVIKPIEVREEQFPEWEGIRRELKNFLYERRITGYSKELIEKLKQEIYTKIML